MTLNSATVTEKVMDEMERSGDIPWRIVLQVWWAQTWRWSLVTAVAGGIMWTSFNILPLNSDLAKECVHLAMNLIVIIAAIWATRRSLNVRYRTFSIVIETISPQEPVVSRFECGR